MQGIWVGNALHGYTANTLQTVNESLGKVFFVREQAIHCGVRIEAAPFVLPIRRMKVTGHCLADPREIVHGCGNSGHAFMALRAGFEATWNLVRCWTNLVRFKRLKHLATPPQYPLMRAEKLVG